MSHVAPVTPVSDAAWQSIGDYLNRDRVKLLRSATRKELSEQWSEIAAQEANLEDAILIGLVGGTGVGKSTIINALASEVVSRSGDRRPTTSRVVVYRFHQTELPDDVPLEDVAQPQVLHTRESLTKVILFDFPDFDSAESVHAEILQRYLEHLDVLFIVVDDMKYADLALYQLLRKLDHDPKNLYTLFNKVDKLETRYPGRSAEIERDLQNDFRSKLAEHAKIDIDTSHQFAIAAQPVLKARLGESGNAENGDGAERERAMLTQFEQIEALLERFQQDKHRRAAKERNLDARKSRLAAELRESAIGSENQAIIRESQQLVDTWRNELSKSMAAISTEVFSDDMRRGVRKTRLRKESAAWGIPVSLIMTLLTETIGRGRASATGQPAELGARFHAHYHSFFQALQNLQHRFSAEFVGSTLAKPDDVDLPQRSESVTLDAARKFQAEILQKTHRPRTISKWSTHLPAMGVLFMAIWSRIYPVLASATGESDRGLIRSMIGALVTSLSPTFIILTLLGVILAYAVTAFWCWLRVIHHADADILEGETEIRAAVTDFGEKTLGRLDSEVHELHEEFAYLDQLLKA